MPEQPVEMTQHLADAVAEVVGRSGYSLSAFAHHAEVDRATLERIIGGQTRRPRRDTLVAIAKAAGLPWDALLRVADGDDLPAIGDAATPNEKMLELLEAQNDRIEALARTVEELTELVKTRDEPDHPDG